MQGGGSGRFATGCQGHGHEGECRGVTGEDAIPFAVLVEHIALRRTARRTAQSQVATYVFHKDGGQSVNEVRCLEL